MYEDEAFCLAIGTRTIFWWFSWLIEAMFREVVSPPICFASTLAEAPLPPFPPLPSCDTLPPSAELPSDAPAAALPSSRLLAEPPFADPFEPAADWLSLLLSLWVLLCELSGVAELVSVDELEPATLPPLSLAAESPPMAPACAEPLAVPPLAPLAELLFEPAPPAPPVTASATLLYAVLHCDRLFDWVLELLPELLAEALFEALLFPFVEDGSFELLPFDCGLFEFDVIVAVDGE